MKMIYRLTAVCILSFMGMTSCATYAGPPGYGYGYAAPVYYPNSPVYGYVSPVPRPYFYGGGYHHWGGGGWGGDEGREHGGFGHFGHR